jgi:ATP-dependent Clp protease ATP-binding subunit ClpA
MQEGESAKLLRMEEELKKNVIGQDNAVSVISKALRRSRADLKNPDRPIGSFIFLGPTGVGKTLLAKALAEFMFGDADALIQVDMSEYMEKFNVSRLVGSPPGYVGHGDGGELTEKSAAVLIRWFSLTRSRRHIPMYCTCFCKSLKRGASPILWAEKSTSAIPLSS